MGGLALGTPAVRAWGETGRNAPKWEASGGGVALGSPARGGRPLGSVASTPPTASSWLSQHLGTSVRLALSSRGSCI